MKTKLLLPLVLGLLLVGCSRNSSNKTASSAPPANTANTLPDAQAVAASQPPPTSSTNALPANPLPSLTPSVSVNIPPPNPPIESAPPASEIPAAPPEEASPTAVAAASDPAASAASEHLAARIVEWNLTSEKISEELTQSDRIERFKNIGAGAPTGDMDTGVVTEAIAGKLQSDTEIAPLKFGVMVLGAVATLTGSATSADQIGRAMALALDTDGVSKVVSRIKLEPATSPTP